MLCLYDIEIRVVYRMNGLKKHLSSNSLTANIVLESEIIPTDKGIRGIAVSLLPRPFTTGIAENGSFSLLFHTVYPRIQVTRTG